MDFRKPVEYALAAALMFGPTTLRAQSTTPQNSTAPTAKAPAYKLDTDADGTPVLTGFEGTADGWTNKRFEFEVKDGVVRGMHENSSRGDEARHITSMIVKTPEGTMAVPVGIAILDHYGNVKGEYFAQNVTDDEKAALEAKSVRVDLITQNQNLALGKYAELSGKSMQVLNAAEGRPMGAAPAAAPLHFHRENFPMKGWTADYDVTLGTDGKPNGISGTTVFSGDARGKDKGLAMVSRCSIIDGQLVTDIDLKVTQPNTVDAPQKLSGDSLTSFVTNMKTVLAGIGQPVRGTAQAVTASSPANAPK